MAELALDDAERMLDLGAHFRDEAVDPVVEWMQLAANRGLAQFKRQANDPGDRLKRRTPQNLPGPENSAARSAFT